MKPSFCNVMVFIAMQFTFAANTAHKQPGDFENVPIIGPEGLNGEGRVLVDGMAAQGECDMMLDLAQIGVRPRYDVLFAYSDYEMFEGLDVIQAAELAELGVVPVEYADKFLTLTEQARQFLQNYFRLKQKLFFEYTHLVCRTAVPFSAGKRPETDPSHNVHVDNCLLHYDDWSCTYQTMYNQRHYSAIMFLNDDFEGGDFFFAHRNNHTAQTVVQPKCGRLVGFSSGPENPHGVQAVVRGRRCVLAMWYTLFKEYDEMPRYEARKLLDSLLRSEVHRSNEKLRNDL
ncbi:prolyl 3-hydroxylase 1-like [Branchiostoma floridae x Branchiostoma belcheri]